MSVKVLYEGHYRALERDFLDLMARQTGRSETLRVIAAGSEQLRRLRELTAEAFGGGIVHGIRFLPGIGHLARDLHPLPAPPQNVSHFDRTALALDAMSALNEGEPFHELRDNPNTAHSLGCFFEELFEHGVTPELYEVTAMSLQRGSTQTERVVGEVFAGYGRGRALAHVACADMTVESCRPSVTDCVFVFYGFYDLNPLQRRFVRRLFSSRVPVYWFSPVSANSVWSGVYRRTRKMLEEAGVVSTARSDVTTPISDLAAFLEAACTGASPPAPVEGLRVTAGSGETGACRAALSRVEELLEGGTSPWRIAVVRRKGEGDSLARLAHHEGVPVNAPLRARLLDMPEAGLLMDMVRFLESDMYWAFLEDILSRGLLGEEYAADPAEAGLAAGSGVRWGARRWRDWYSSEAGACPLGALMRKLDLFSCSLPHEARPREYLERYRILIDELGVPDPGSAIFEAIFDRSRYRFGGRLTRETFNGALRLQLSSFSVELRKADPLGFRVLTVEQLRGAVYDAVILMDMEEGIYPGPPFEDPRLGEELRAALQMAPRSQREEEDGLLLRQAGEAASLTLDIVYREEESDGGELAPSPFIAPFLMKHRGLGREASWFRRGSSSPVEQLLGGRRSGQTMARGRLRGDLSGGHDFVRAFTAEVSRMDPSRFSVHDGMLEKGALRPPERYSPTLLEAYARCPFALLAGRIWGLDRSAPPDAGTEADPRNEGRVVHSAVERLVREEGFDPPRERIREVLEEEAVSFGLCGSFGTKALAGVFLDGRTDDIARSLSVLGERGWSFLAAEERITGELDGMPVEGRLDLVLEDGKGELVLLDLKTGRLPSRREVMEARKHFQLPFYYHLAGERWPGRRTVLAACASVGGRSPGRLLGFTAGEMEEAVERASAGAAVLAEMMERGIYPPAPTAGCERCPFRGLCRRTPYRRIRWKVENDERVACFRGMLSRS